MLRIGIDIDGCLADFTRAFGQMLIKVTGKDMLPPNWKNDPDFPAVWDWDIAAGYTSDDANKAWARVHENEKFWELLHPLDDTPAVIHQLNDLATAGNDIYYITNRAGRKAKYQTERFLYNLGMLYPTVLLSSKKLPVVYGLDLNCYIDDKPETVQELAEFADAQQTVLRGNIFLKSAPYNKSVVQSNITRVKNVEEMLRIKGLWQ